MEKERNLFHCNSEQGITTNCYFHTLCGNTDPVINTDPVLKLVEKIEYEV